MGSKLNTWLDRLLERFCDPHLFEGIKGDLLELYAYDLETGSTQKAKWRHLLRVIGFFRIVFLNKSRSMLWQKVALLRSYFTTTWRVGLRNKTSTTVNLSGLILGITACIFLALYIHHEWSYERHFTNHERTYRLVIDMEYGNELVELAITPTGLAHKVHSELSQVTSHTILRRYSHFHFHKGEELVSIKRMYRTDQNLHEIFDYQWVAGDPLQALKNPHSLVVTTTTAQRLFGDSYALGQTITADDGSIYTVTGIITDPPATSHFHPEAFVSMTDPTEQLSMDAWRWAAYIQLKEGVQAAAFQQELDQLANEIFTATGHNGRGKIWVKMQPLTDIHFTSRRKFELEPNDGNLLYLKGFCILFLLILLMSIVNFINLSTAQASQRLKEIQVRKTFGAFQGNIRGQFLFETACYVLFALLISILLVGLLQPAFEHFAEVSSPLSIDWPTGGLVIGGFLVLTYATGLYPAKYVAKLAASRNPKTKGFRSSLVLIQLTLCTLVISATTVIYLQINFMNQQDLGFNKEQVMYVNLDQSDREHFHELSNALQQLPAVTHVAATYQLPGDIPPVNNFQFHTADGEQKLVCPHIYVDHGFLDALQIELLAGSNFKPYRGEESIGLIVNEQFLRSTGWSPQEAIGKTLKSGTRFEDKIIGVIRNFHFNSLHTAIEPLVIRHASGSQYMLVRLATQDLSATINQMTDTWQEIAQTPEVNFAFLDQNFQQQYNKDEKRADFFAGTSLLIIFISLSGLFGLSTYAAQRRLKEMSIRKVHGANQWHIIQLMTGPFFRLSLLAAVLATPAAYWLLTRWLQNFAYAITLQWWMLLVPVSLLMLLVVSVLSVKCFQVVWINPAKILRNE
ncbi:ABC transporter permease [Marinoscillum furvescens]|uniref:Putative ABC transport system permease protein n=1 Tax=Marinoscillum furvescens DSM 4134 TaxID=1122208 RepID=A0A3D9L306_MARFU|nr:ABC transporter permease [Marinoscillum furvescens]RED99413.1 putative ABC transport system permease protein [Marinoscillum furvescens DSM 4134]